MGYLSAKSASDLWGISKRRVLVLCKEGRLLGAQKIGSTWVIPDDTIKPNDGRSTRYQNERATNMKTLPIGSSVKADNHTPQYKMHKYFARRPYNVFSHLIKHYSKKGDIILDCFCGGGVTIFEAAALGRKPIGVDINPLATFVTRMQLFNGEINELKDFYHRFLITIKKKYADWYKVKFDDDEGTAIWVEWVYTVICPECQTTIELLEKNKVSNGIYYCPNQHCSKHKTGIKRVACTPYGSRPLRVNYVSSKTNQTLTREATIDNLPIFCTINFNQIIEDLHYKPEFKIPENWDRQYEDRLQDKGIVNYSDFFTDRNYTLNCLIFNEIMKLKGTTGSQLNEYLYFLFSSSLRYTNKMTRVTDNWEGGKPTAMDKHAFWLPNQYVETNIINVLSQRSEAILRGCDYSSRNIPTDYVEVKNFEDMKLHNSYMVLNRSATSIPIPDESIDVVITDPPYGSNVQYAELSTIWNAWFAIYNNLDDYIFNKEEAVVNRKASIDGSKTIDHYEKLLYEVFLESARTLKPEGYLVFTFNNKNIKVWIAMLRAVSRAGFFLPEDGILFQDYIDAYKNTSHLRFTGNIHGDFIYTFKKGVIPSQVDGTRDFKDIINDSIDKTINKLYKKRKSYTTPELYQKILTNMTMELMRYINWQLSVSGDLEDISDFSNEYLENRLNEKLSCEEGKWRKK